MTALKFYLNSKRIIFHGLGLLLVLMVTILFKAWIDLSTTEAQYLNLEHLLKMTIMISSLGLLFIYALSRNNELFIYGLSLFSFGFLSVWMLILANFPFQYPIAVVCLAMSFLSALKVRAYFLNNEMNSL